MKKFVSRIFTITLAVSMASIPLASAAQATSYTQVNAVMALNEHEFTLVSAPTTVLPYGENRLDVTEFTASTASGNYLFDASSFESALEQAEDVKTMIVNGSTIAVFDKNGIPGSYEEKLMLPLGYSESVGENNVQVGCIYSTDSSGKPFIGRYSVSNTSEDLERSFENFVAYIDEFMDRTHRSVTRASAGMEFIGSISDFFEGSKKKGNIEVTYEISTAQNIDSYDYYAVHLFVDATPGDALHHNGYDVDAITSHISSPSSQCTLYKTGPNTTTGATEYSVDIGFSGSQDGTEVSYNVGWTREIPDVNISKLKVSSSECAWDVDVDDRTPPADSTITFEPGGTFRLPASASNININGYHSMMVDSAFELPSQAVAGTSSFYCNADRVW